MTTKIKIFENDHTYFITFTCYNWLPLFEITSLYEHIYNWFDILIKKHCQIIGYVIMPNHIHILVFISSKSGKIDTLIGNGKRFMAYQIVENLKRKNDFKTLNKLVKGLNINEIKKKKQHQVFEPSFDIKICYTNDFVQQKLDYIHLNPVSKKWKLTNDFREYEHSSAKFYELNLPCKTRITHWMDAGNYEEFYFNKTPSPLSA